MEIVTVDCGKLMEIVTVDCEKLMEIVTVYVFYYICILIQVGNIGFHWKRIGQLSN